MFILESVIYSSSVVDALPFPPAEASKEQGRVVGLSQFAVPLRLISELHPTHHQ